jgi:hypothetical protein
LDQALAVSQAFSHAKLRILRLLFQNFSFGTASEGKIMSIGVSDVSGFSLGSIDGDAIYDANGRKAGAVIATTL